MGPHPSQREGGARAGAPQAQGGVQERRASPLLKPLVGTRSPGCGVVFTVSCARLSEAGVSVGEPRARSEPGALNRTAAKERRRPDRLRRVGKVGSSGELRRSVRVHFLGCGIALSGLVAANSCCGSGVQAQLRCVSAPGLSVGCSPGVGRAARSSGESAGEAGSRLTQVAGGIYFLVAEGPRISLHHGLHLEATLRPCLTAPSTGTSQHGRLLLRGPGEALSPSTG